MWLISKRSTENSLYIVERDSHVNREVSVTTFIK